MSILILNQHTSNHGDEAAGKALIRGIRESAISERISILYNIDELKEIEKFKVDNNIEHFCSKKSNFFDKILLVLTFILPFCLIKYFFKFGNFTKYEYNLIQNYENIINGPGGVNIGPYKDWKYIWRLYVSLKLNKKVAMYSISFGPIPKNFLFKRVSEYILSNVDFLSLRDNKSQKYADDLSIDYIKSIDTAFLNNQPFIEIPKEILLEDKYVVVVPNQLDRWHPNFKEFNSNDFEELYVSVINYFLSMNLKIVLLPQLYGSQNDSIYFNRLAEKSINSKDVVIIKDVYSSDIQQKIISKAEFLIGARYHTIIFSVNNKRPFLSLAYEHKMTNTLELIGLSENNVLLKDVLEKKINIIDHLNKRYNNRLENQVLVESGSNEANTISHNTLEKLIHTFLNK